MSNVAGFGENLLTLTELQAKLATIELRQNISAVKNGGSLLLGGLVVAVASLPVVLVGVAELLVSELAFKRGYALLIVAGTAARHCGTPRRHRRSVTEPKTARVPADRRRAQPQHSVDSHRAPAQRAACRPSLERRAICRQLEAITSLTICPIRRSDSTRATSAQPIIPITSEPRRPRERGGRFDCRKASHTASGYHGGPPPPPRAP